jgi:hypothetical protein
VLAADGHLTISSVLQLRTGAGGRGGLAVATGGKGSDANASGAAKAGGDATAAGGDGGDASTWEAYGSGGVTGVANVHVTAASAVQGGSGGTATATAGNGGRGNEASPNGAAGGTLSAIGGRGGSATALDGAGTPVALGGNGGAARFFGGLGGHGFAYCLPLDPRAGGAGGPGGDAAGSGGSEGAPAVPGGPTGLPGVVELEYVGNGGAGGHGGVAGAGGARGVNSIVNRGTINSKGTNFQLGASGDPCLYSVLFVIKDDPFNNNPLVGYTSLTEIAISASPTHIRITGMPGIEFLSGTRLESDSTFIAVGIGTFSGIANVAVRMVGTLGGSGAFVATLTIGSTAVPTGLPGGPIVYTVHGAPLPSGASGVRARRLR